MFSRSWRRTWEGGNTAKHPIEAVLLLGGEVPGQGVEAFDSMTSKGLWVIQRGYFNVRLSDAEKGHIAAPREGDPERHAHQIKLSLVSGSSLS